MLFPPAPPHQCPLPADWYSLLWQQLPRPETKIFPAMLPEISNGDHGMPLLTLLPFSDAGYRTYFYEFQHRPSAHANLKPAFVKSDHGDEIGFVFGKPFLAGEKNAQLCKAL